jgi:dihydroorotase
MRLSYSLPEEPSMTNSLTILRPDDWHIHLRDGELLNTTVKDVANTFSRAIIMPNLVPPVMNAQQILAYKNRILAATPEQSNFEPLMVLYLTDNTSAEMIKQAADVGVVACKLYPAGATTNSDSGVTDIKKIYPAIEAMQTQGMKFLLHGEVTDSDIDIFDREKAFIDRTLITLVRDFPELKIVMEHITTRDAAEFIAAAGSNLAATITAHHLLFNRNHMLAGGIRPHYYCLPILKRQSHQQALIAAATSGNPAFFLGTDSAPHTQDKKEAACGCAGSYTAYHALELYTEVFDQAGALDKLENFCSGFGPDFYDLPRNTETVTLLKNDWQVPETLALGDSKVVPIRAGETLHWQIQR